MMMYRRHAKNSLASQLERSHLQNNRERFHHKNSTDKKQKDFLLDDHRDQPERPAQGKRAHVAHEDFRGMRVVPKKSQGSAHQRPAKNGKLANSRNVLNFEISGPTKIAAHVSEHRKRTGSDNRAPDSQAIETVREIHGVGCSSDHQRNEKQKRQKR